MKLPIQYRGAYLALRGKTTDPASLVGAVVVASGHDVLAAQRLASDAFGVGVKLIPFHLAPRLVRKRAEDRDRAGTLIVATRKTHPRPPKVSPNA